MSHLWKVLVASALLCLLPGLAQAGLHYSGEPIAELPSQWRGFLTDLRTLRNVAIAPGPNVPANPLRERYEVEAKRLQEAGKSRRLSADEQADLGALLIRLGEVQRAVQVLRAAQRGHPGHFPIAANLGTAWQLAGDLARAEEALRLAVRLAPDKQRKGEEYQLKLVRLRMRQPRGYQESDDLFGVRFVGPSGQYEAGKLAATQREKLPKDAVAIAQQLALWLPSDAKLLWLLGELANAHGDVKAASEIFESCVGQFALTSRTLREHRAMVREALTQLAKQPPGSDAARTEHEAHAGLITPKSRRPLALKRFDPRALPAVSKDATNPLPWPLLLESTVDRQFRPTFPKHLQQLNGLQVNLTGFMQPLTDELELSAFLLIEYPTGCWYCEMPEITGIVLVELPEAKSVTYSRNMVKITGKLVLNATDPENFLYTITEASVGEAD